MSEVYVDKNGIAHDDEGHSWKAPGFAKGVYSGTHISPRSKLNVKRKRPEINREKLDALYLALYYEPKNRILSYAAKVLAKGGEVNAKEAKQIRDIMKKNGMKKEAKLFEDRGIGMRKLLGRLEEMKGKKEIRKDGVYIDGKLWRAKPIKASRFKKAFGGYVDMVKRKEIKKDEKMGFGVSPREDWTYNEWIEWIVNVIRSDNHEMSDDEMIKNPKKAFSSSSLYRNV